MRKRHRGGRRQRPRSCTTRPPVHDFASSWATSPRRRRSGSGDLRGPEGAPLISSPAKAGIHTLVVMTCLALQRRPHHRLHHLVREVLAGAPVLITPSTTRDDGSWAFLDGEPYDPDDAFFATLEELFTLHPDLAAVADLPEAGPPSAKPRRRTGEREETSPTLNETRSPGGGPQVVSGSVVQPRCSCPNEETRALPKPSVIPKFAQRISGTPNQNPDHRFRPGRVPIRVPRPATRVTGHTPAPLSGGRRRGGVSKFVPITPDPPVGPKTLPACV